ncbi:MAG: tyrosine-type recombinase/integrase [Bacteroidetes bacterium]|nr:tyrosine-type recombinase/integrase [Bacteroidota bacterium]
MIKYYPVLWKRIAKDGTSKVYIKVYFESNSRIFIPTAVNVEPVFWDNEQKKVKDSHPLAEDYNLLINEIIYKKIHPILKDYSLQHKIINKKQFEAEYHKLQTSSENMINWITLEIHNLTGARNASTITAYNQMLEWLKRYNKSFTPDEFTPEFVTNFDNYLIKSGLNINTRSKHLKNLKVFSRIYFKNNYSLHKCPFREVKIKRGSGRIVFLEKKELEKLENTYSLGLLKQNHPLQHNILRMFLFSVYTCGMRISDIVKLSEKNVYDNVISFVPQKTEHENKSMDLPISKGTMRILDDIRKEGRRKYFFEDINEDTARKYLKEIAILCGIRKNLSMHVARHTFATNFYRSTKDLVTLQQLLGHSKIETTMIYTHHDDEMKTRGMELFESYMKKI